MTGDRSLITEIAIEAGSKKIKQVGYQSMNNETAYLFETAPTTPEFTLSVSYFTDMKTAPVMIEK